MENARYDVHFHHMEGANMGSGMLITVEDGRSVYVLLNTAKMQPDIDALDLAIPLIEAYRTLPEWAVNKDNIFYLFNGRVYYENYDPSDFLAVTFKKSAWPFCRN